MEVAEKIGTKTSTIWIDQEGILRLQIKEDAEVNLHEAQLCFEAYKKLGCQKNKVLQLMEGGSFFSYDKVALKYIAKQGGDFFIASAMVHDSLAIRILFNFFNNFFNRNVPFKLFRSKEKALE